MTHFPDRHSGTDCRVFNSGAGHPVAKDGIHAVGIPAIHAGMTSLIYESLNKPEHYPGGCVVTRYNGLQLP